MISKKVKSFKFEMP